MNVQNKKSVEEEQSGADAFLGVGLFLVSCIAGVFIGLYWRLWVLDRFISTDDVLSGWLLIVLYAPVGVLAVIVGFIWFLVFHKIFSLLGIKVIDLSKIDE